MARRHGVRYDWRNEQRTDSRANPTTSPVLSPYNTTNHHTMAYRGLRRLFTAAAFAIAGTLTGHAQFVVSITNSIGAFLDGTSATRDFVVTSSDILAAGIITDVTLTIDFAKGDASAPSSPAYADEIGITLSRGATTMDVVFAGQWQPDEPYFSGVMKFSDFAATPSWMLPGPAAGEFQAWSFFDVFFNVSLEPSVWTLGLTDTLGGAPLQFRSATLEITVQPTGAVPEPSTWALAGVGALATLVAFRRFLHRARPSGDAACFRSLRFLGAPASTTGHPARRARRAVWSILFGFAVPTGRSGPPSSTQSPCKPANFAGSRSPRPSRFSQAPCAPSRRSSPRR